MTAAQPTETLAPSSPARAVPRVTVTVRPAPRREPSFDDEQPSRHLHLVRLEPTLPFQPWPGRLIQRLPWAAPRPTGRGDLPEPTAWARRLLIAVLVAHTGRRPWQQLTRYFQLAANASPADELRGGKWPVGAPATLKSVHVCEPADGVAEVSAVIQVGHRCRAVAIRLEGLDGRWRCVSLQLV